MTESEGRQALVSPAVIPSTKVKQEISVPVISSSPYSLPVRPNIPEIEREEEYSEDEFKDSEES